jgi:anthranilate phosphoribosyltransferase
MIMPQPVQPSSLKAEEVLKHLWHEEPSHDFLKETQHGLTAAEMADLVRKLRANANLPMELKLATQALSIPLIDVCGTGGTPGSRLNTSTLSALFLPSYGVGVIKHGGRSASGKKGSLDLLENLGFDLNGAFVQAGEAFRAFDLCFLGAGFTYAPFAKYAPLRKAFGAPTLFNLLGPLLNPVSLSTRLLGTYNPAVQDLLAQVLEHLKESALLVCSHDDEGFLDEGTPWSLSRLVFVHPEKSSTHFETSVRAWESKPAPRSELFADGVLAAQKMLAQTNHERIDNTDISTFDHSDSSELEAASARKMVAFNVALARVAVGFLQKSGEARNFPEHVESSLWPFYQDVHAAWAPLCAQGKRRIAGLSKLTNSLATHPRSPTQTPSAALATETAAQQASLEKKGASDFLLTPVASAEHKPRPFRFRNATNAGLLIAEVKNRSPQRQFHGGLSLEERLSAYARADAISVVTHPQFEGSLDLLARVRQLTPLPILAKDFIRTAEEATALVQAGADGVLVLEDMVGTELAKSLCLHIESLGATAFVESSWGVPKGFGKAIPMLNARNLFSLLENPLYRNNLASQLMMKNSFVSASSYKETWQVVLARAAGASVVVGSALMQLAQVSQIENWLMECQKPGLLKACGAADDSDAKRAFEAGAQWIGVNLISRSKRCIEFSNLEKLLANPSGTLLFLTDATTDASMLSLLSEVRFSYLEQCYDGPRLPGACGVVVPFGAPRHENSTVCHLLDSSQPGSGIAQNYPTATSYAPKWPILCAGGINAYNALERKKEAITKGHAFAGFDAATGVEKRNAQGKRIGFDEEVIAKIASFVRH